MERMNKSRFTKEIYRGNVRQFMNVGAERVVCQDRETGHR